MPVTTFTVEDDGRSLNGAAPGFFNGAVATGTIGSQDTGKFGEQSSYGYFKAPISLPLGSTVTAATFNFYMITTQGSSATTFRARRITSDWTDATGSTPTLDTAIRGTGPSMGTADGAWYAIDITTLVQEWIAATSPNYGVRVDGSQTSEDYATVSFIENGSNTAYYSVTYTTVTPGQPGAFTVPAGGESIDASISANWGDGTTNGGPAITYSLNYSKDGGPETPIVSGLATSDYVWNTSALAAGSYVLKAYAFNGYNYSAVRNSNAFTISHITPPPTAVVPLAAATVDTDVPTLGATVTNNGGALQRIEWQLATDAGFTANVRTVLEPLADARASGVTTEVVPEGMQLFQGTWYIRARSVPNVGGVSSWTASQTFTVTHPPVMASQTPTGGVGVNFGSGSVPFDWNFSDTSPVDSQTAYEIEVERVSDALSVADTGKMISTLTNANVNISVTYKGVPLRWRGRVWDSDDVVGAWSAYQLFTASDLPVPAIQYPVHGTTLISPAPTITWTFTASGRTQTHYRVTIVDAALGTTVHDSGWVASAATSHAVGSSILTYGSTYNVTVWVRDNTSLENSDTNTASAFWTAPASPTFVVTV